MLYQPDNKRLQIHSEIDCIYEVDGKKKECEILSRLEMIEAKIVRDHQKDVRDNWAALYGVIQSITYLALLTDGSQGVMLAITYIRGFI